MKITFIQPHNSPMSGNSYYPAGARADLETGTQLVNAGIAVVGWVVVDIDPPTTLEQTVSTEAPVESPIEALTESPVDDEPSVPSPEADDDDDEEIDWKVVPRLSERLAAELVSRGLTTYRSAKLFIAQNGRQGLVALPHCGDVRAEIIMTHVFGKRK